MASIQFSVKEAEKDGVADRLKILHEARKIGPTLDGPT